MLQSIILIIIMERYAPVQNYILDHESAKDAGPLSLVDFLELLSNSRANENTGN